MPLSEARENLKSIYAAAISAVDPAAAMESHLKREDDVFALYSDGRLLKTYDLKKYERFIVIGAGKAAAPMAKAVESILGDLITTGCICVKYGYTETLSKIETVEAAHPVPDAEGVRGTRRILELLAGAGSRDLVISLISGGGSALLVLPPDPISLDDKRATTELLLRSGAGIHEINAVRKHLSLVKGGNLAKASGEATVVNLIVSDVIGDDIGVIASGPFAPDDTTFREALLVLERYGLTGAAPREVVSYLESGARGALEENPGPKNPAFHNKTNLIIASNIMALEAAKKAAEEKGYRSLILSSQIEGDTRDTALWHSRIAREILNSSNPIPAPACIISGGETTVKVTGKGLGGRNMEFAMHMSVFIEGLEEVTAASIGTDGTDGPTDAAGAVVDGLTLFHAKEKGIDVREYIKRNDSYPFHKELNNLIITGPTNTNVMDLRILIVE